MKVLLDVDNVLADLTGYLLKQIRSDRSWEDHTDYWIFDLIEKWHGKGRLDEAHKVMANPDFWRAQPVLPGAVDAVETIRSAGARVVCVTSPWEGCKEWGSARRAWLLEHFGIKKDDVAEVHDKALIGGDIFVDDYPKNVRAWRDAYPQKPCFVFDQPYNRASSDSPFLWPERICWHEASEDLPGSEPLYQAIRDYQSA